MQLIKINSALFLYIIQFVIFLNIHTLIHGMQKPIILPLPENFLCNLIIKKQNDKKYQNSIQLMLFEEKYEQLTLNNFFSKNIKIQPLSENLENIQILAITKNITYSKHTEKLFVDTLYTKSFSGNQTAQILLSSRLLERCNISQEYYKTQTLQEQKKLTHQLINYASEYIAFLLQLSAKNIPIAPSTELIKRLFKIRDKSLPTLQFLLQLCRYLLAQTENEKRAALNVLIHKKEDIDAYIKEICLFLINYHDSTLSVNSAAKRFITNISKQENIAQFTQKIIKQPLCDLIVDKLHKATLSAHNKELSDLNIILAEIYYYDKKFDKAHEFFLKNDTHTILNNTIHPGAYHHAFNAYLVNTNEFSEHDIKNLSSLANGDIYSYLLNIKLRTPILSYKIALLIYTLLKESDLELTNQKKIELINMGLSHLRCADDEKNLTLQLKIMLTQLFSDKKTALKYMISAMKHDISHKENNELIIKILKNTRDNAHSSYNKYASLLFYLLQLINNQQKKNSSINMFNLNLLNDFFSNNNFSQLLIFFEQTYKTQYNKNEILAYLITSYYENQKAYTITRHYIDQLKSMSEKMLLFKTKFYTKIAQSLPHEEFRSFLENIILNDLTIKNNTFFSENIETITAATLLAKDFFITSPDNYELALKLISQYCTLPTIPIGIMKLIRSIYRHLITNKSSYLDTWNKELNKFQAVSEKMFLLKSYTKLSQSLPHKEFRFILENQILKNHANNIYFSKNAKIFANAALLAKDFFTACPDNYDLALKLICQYCTLPTLPIAIIKLAHNVYSHLIENKSSYLDTWNEELNKSQFYNKFEAASNYDQCINYLVAELLMFQEPPNPAYEKIISHIIATRNNQNMLSLREITLKQYCSGLYYSWALSMAHDENEYLRLLDIAIYDYNNRKARDEKAKHILLNKPDPVLIKEAKSLLEQNIQEYGMQEGETTILLAHAYLHGLFQEKEPNKELSKVFPFDIDKAIEYLTNSTEFIAKHMLAIIYSGIALNIDNSIKDKYINYEKTLHYTDILLNNNYQLPYILTARNCAHCRHSKPHKALDEINKYFKKNILSDEDKDNLDLILTNTFSLILDFTIKNNDYTNAIKCFEKRYELYKKRNLHLRFNTIARTQEYVTKILNENIITESAIKWCYYAILDECFQHPGKNPTITYNPLLLMQYMYNAAKCGNIDAQLCLLLYGTNGYASILTSNLSTDLFYYAHKGLTHPLLPKKRNIDFLIQRLQYLSDQGNSLACFILLNFFKYKTNEFEQIITKFDKTHLPIYYPTQQPDLIEEIIKSCHDTFNKYLNNNTIKPLNIAATVMFATMHFCIQKKEYLQKAIHYYENILTILSKTNLPHIKKRVDLLLGQTYYYYASLENTSTIKIDLLKKAAQLCHFNSCHKLASIYLANYYIFQLQPLHINEADYLLPLKKHTKIEKNVFPECINILNYHDEMLGKIDQLEKISKNITHKAYEKQMIRTKYNQDSKKLADEALQCYELDKDKGINRFIEIGDSGKSPLLLIIYACKFLIVNDFCKQNYEISRISLDRALSCGLVRMNNNDQIKFDDGNFLNMLFIYINSLLKDNHPLEIVQALLTTIKRKLHENKINLDIFCTLLQEKCSLNLTAMPLWNNIKLY